MKKFVFELRPLRASFSRELGVALLPSKYIYGVVGIQRNRNSEV